MRTVRIDPKLAWYALLCSAATLSATENRWLGAGGDRAWTNAANWSLGAVPDSTQDVVIEQTDPTGVLLDAPAEAASLTLGGPVGSATLNIIGGSFWSEGASLIATNALVNLAGELHLYGGVQLEGVLNWTSGALETSGASVVGPSGLLAISGTGPKTLSGQLCNNGTLSSSAAALLLMPGCQFTNNSLLVLYTNLMLTQSMGGFSYPGFYNNGTILAPTNAGTVTLVIGCAFENRGTLKADTNAVLELVAGQVMVSLQSGTVFAGAGVVRFPGPNNYLGCFGPMQLNGVVDLDGAFIFGGSVWSGPGLLRWESGSMSGFIFGPDLHVDMTGPGDKEYEGICVNQGTVRWLTPAWFTSGSGSTFNNSGQFILQADCTLSTAVGYMMPGTLTNSGTILAPAGLGTITLDLRGNFFNQGTIRPDTNTVLALLAGSGAVAFEPGTVFDGAGVVRFPGPNNYLGCFGPMQLNGVVDLDGASIFGGSVWSGPGLLRWESGSLSGFTFGPDLHVDMTGTGDKEFEGICVNQGTVRWLTPAWLTSGSGSSFANSGQFILQADCTLGLAMGYMYPAGTFTNLGTVLAPADNGILTLSMQANFINQGTIKADPNTVLQLQAGPVMAAFEPGTVFDGAGVVRFPGPNNYFACFGAIQLNGTVELDGGSAFGGALWSGPGLLRWESGSMSGFIFGPDLHVDMTGPADKEFEAICINQGTVRWLTPAWLTSGSGSTFDNAGQFILQANCTLSTAVGYMLPGTLTNSGTILAPAGLGTITLDLRGNFFNQGTVQADANTGLDVHAGAGSVSFEPGTVFNGAGMVRFPGTDSYLGVFGLMQINGTVDLNGAMIFGTPAWGGPGLLRWESGGMNGLVTMPEMHVEVTGSGDKRLDGSSLNQGTLHWLGEGWLRTCCYPAFNNAGLLSIETNCNWEPGILLTNLPGGTLRQLAGQFSLGPLNNRGVLELDHGSINASGCFDSAEGVHRVALDGYVPGPDFGQLNAQTLAPAGLLAVTLANSFVPTNGSSFAIATDWMRIGEFASTSLPALPSGLSWRVQYSPDAITLRVIGPSTIAASARLADGRFLFTLSGNAGSGYEVQVSSNLVDWATLEANGPFSGSILFTDTNACTLERRFYRARILE